MRLQYERTKLAITEPFWGFVHWFRTHILGADHEWADGNWDGGKCMRCSARHARGDGE